MDLFGFAVEALYLTLYLSAPVLIVSLVVGTGVGIFQAMTQVQDFSLSFVPKLFAVAIVLALSFDWMGNRIVIFTTNLWKSIPQIVQ